MSGRGAVACCTPCRRSATSRKAVGNSSLRPKVLSLGFAYLSSFTLTGLALPFMEELVARVQESVYVSVLDSADIVYVARVPTKRIMSIDISIGTRLPATMTSIGTGPAWRLCRIRRSSRFLAPWPTRRDPAVRRSIWMRCGRQFCKVGGRAGLWSIRSGARPALDCRADPRAATARWLPP